MILLFYNLQLSTLESTALRMFSSSTVRTVVVKHEAQGTFPSVHNATAAKKATNRVPETLQIECNDVYRNSTTETGRRHSVQGRTSCP